MKTILILLRKEFRQIFRNHINIPILLVLPVVQLLVLSNAADFEIRHLKVHTMDFDQTSTSRALISKISASPYFDVVNTSHSGDAAAADIARDKATLVVRIPRQFEKDMMVENNGNVQLLINAIDGSAASVSYGYIQSIISDFNKQIAIEWIGEKSFAHPAAISPVTSFWYNPEMNYKAFMVPGLLVVLVTMIGLFLAGMNIVREKEIGTIEQLNVTPIKKYQFIIGKLLPFWLIGLFELGLGLALAKLVFDIPIVGSICLVFLFAGAYMLAILGIGLFISNIAHTQQQAMFISFFFMMIFILMSGLFTPLESMPAWAQKIAEFNPVAYFISVIRMVMLKGATLADIRIQFFTVLGGALLILGLATWKYKKVVA